MKYKSVLVMHMGDKAKTHEKIMEKLLEPNADIDELVFSGDSQSCPESSIICNKVPQVEALLIYISKDTKNNACISEAVKEANKSGVKIFAIWLDEECSISGIGDAISNHADGVFSSREELVEEISDMDGGVWQKPDGSDMDKRSIKRHKCG